MSIKTINKVIEILKFGSLSCIKKGEYWFFKYQMKEASFSLTSSDFDVIIHESYEFVVNTKYGKNVKNT